MSTKDKPTLSPQAIFARRRAQTAPDAPAGTPSAGASTLSPQAIFAKRRKETSAQAGAAEPTGFRKEVAARVSALSGNENTNTAASKKKSTLIVIPDDKKILTERQLYDALREDG